METINWTQLLSQDVPRRPCLIKTTELGARESECCWKDNQGFFCSLSYQVAAAEQLCRWQLSVKEVNQATKPPTGSPRGPPDRLQGGRLELLQRRDHQSCWTKRNTVELDMTNPRLAEWPKSDSQIALWPIRQLHRFPASGYWHTTVSDKRGNSAGYQMFLN